MGLVVKWDITYKCNLFCEHCINGEFISNDKNELNTEEVLKIIDDLSDSLDLEYIGFLGGEPSVRKDIKEITDHLDSKGIKFGMVTNGLLLKSKTMEGVLLNKSFEQLIVSLEGPNAKINDEIRGKNVFEKIIEGIKHVNMLKKGNSDCTVKIAVNTVLTKMNYMYVNEMIDLCIDLKVDEINFLQLISKGNAESLDLRLSKQQELEVIKTISDRYQKDNDKLKINPKFVRPIVQDYCEKVLNIDFPTINHGCGAGSTFGYLNNVGEMYPCDRYRDILRDEANFNVLKNGFKNVWNKEEFGLAYEISESDKYNQCVPCNQCKHLRVSCYPCPAEMKKDKINVLKDCEYYMDKINSKEA